MRLGAAVAALCLAACADAPTPPEAAPPASAPESNVAETAPKPAPMTDVSTPIVSIVELRAQTARDEAARAACTIREVAREALPEGLVRLRTSPDGRNELFGPEALFLGGDHNVFGEVDGGFAPGGGTAAIRTPDGLFVMEADPALAMNVIHTSHGEVRCTAWRPER